MTSAGISREPIEVFVTVALSVGFALIEQLNWARRERSVSPDGPVGFLAERGADRPVKGSWVPPSRRA